MTVEHTFAFGESRQLVGTMTVPARRAPRAVALLLFNSGVIHRVGPHRFNVKAARRMAGAGVATLRFDLSGLGDAGPARGSSRFDDQAVADLRAAMDEVTARTGIRRFAIHGICSGAVHALAATVADERVVGLAMQDGIVFPTLRARVRRYTLPLREDAMRTARGGWRHLRAMLSDRSGGAPPVASSDGPLGSGGYTPRGFSRTLDALSARGTSTLVIYTGSILNLYNYPGQFDESVRLEASPSRVACAFVPEIDHTMSNRTAQRRLLELLAGWLDAVAPDASAEPCGRPAGTGPELASADGGDSRGLER